MNIKHFFKAVPVLCAAFIAAQSQATTYGFGCITDNISGDCAIGESQLSVDVTAAGSNQALFTFYNVGADLSSITDVYFDDGTLLGIASITNSTGVSFSQDASPGNLPGGNAVSPSFVATAGFTADSDPAVQPNGVNPGEFLGILFDLQSGQDFATVLTSLSTGDLRIGIHVQGFATGGSESFVNVVPVPAAVWLFGSGLLGLIGLARRNR
jgi:hypothetical protein